MNEFIARPIDAYNMPSAAPAGEIQSLYAQVEILGDRERQIMELIGCQTPQRIMHDLRNVMNELQLLRLLTNEMRQ